MNSDSVNNYSPFVFPAPKRILRLYDRVVFVRAQIHGDGLYATLYGGQKPHNFVPVGAIGIVVKIEDGVRQDFGTGRLYQIVTYYVRLDGNTDFLIECIEQMDKPTLNIVLHSIPSFLMRGYYMLRELYFKRIKKENP